MRPLILAFLALLFGCSVGPTMPLPATVELSDELSADQVEGTLAAVEAWNQAVPGIIVATKVRHTPSKKERSIFVAPGTPARAADGHAETTFCRSSVVLADHKAPLTFRIVAHEFGHAFGLDHTTDPTSVMSPTGKLITDEDAEDGARALRNRHENHRACVNKEWLGLN